MTRLFHCAVILAALTLLPSDGLARAASHIRIVDQALKVKFDAGIKRSPTLRQLVEHLEEAPVLVFMDCAPQLPNRIGAYLNLITSVNGVRYVRVEINCAFSDRNLMALLAHELQHAAEIASRVDVLDVDSMHSYYEEFGFESYFDGRHASYETEAAIAIQHRVLIETGK